LAILALESAKEKEKQQQQSTASTATTVDRKKCRSNNNNNSSNSPSRIRKLNAMMEIRRLTSEGYTNDEIAAMLNLPMRSFYRYRALAFAEDVKILKEKNNDTLALEISILHDCLTDLYRHFMSLGSNGRYRARDRLNALTAASEVALAILKLHIQGQLILKSLDQSMKQIELKK